MGQGYLTFLKEEAKKRQIEAVKRGNVSRHSGSPVPPKSVELGSRNESESAVQAGKLVGVSKDSIRDADYVAKRDPEPEPAPRVGMPVNRPRMPRRRTYGGRVGYWAGLSCWRRERAACARRALPAENRAVKALTVPPGSLGLYWH